MNKIDLIEKLKKSPITLIDQDPKYLNLKYIQSLALGKKIVVCDANIEDFFQEKDKNGNDLDKPVFLEGAVPVEGGFQKDNIINIDHHFPLPELSRNITSTNLAIEYVQKNGPVEKDVTVVISHSDCDSILSSAVMRGIIPPDEKYGDAAVAADHTGESNPIADLLQALSDLRDIAFSLRNLQLLTEGQEIEPRAKELVNEREENRERAKEVAEHEIKVSESGNIYYIKLDKKIEGEMMPSLLPNARIIVLMSPLKNKGTGKISLETKARLGLVAPEGTILKKIMQKVDPKWNGRWNAGSNKRNGGQDINLDIDRFIQALDHEAVKYFERLKSSN